MFSNAAFCEDAYFSKAVFSGTAVFENVAFSRIAGFADVAFFGRTLFESVAFSGDAVFSNAAFCEAGQFSNAVFAGPAIFSGDGAVLSAPETSQTILLKEHERDAASRFEGRLTTPSDLTPAARRSFNMIDASGAVFLDNAWFDNRDILTPSSFRDARFYRLPVFHGGRLHYGASFHNARFEGALAPEKIPMDEDRLLQIMPEALLQRLYGAYGREAFLENLREKAEAFSALPQSKSADDKNDKQSKDQYFADLEDAFRTLKLLMEERRNRQQEGLFFRLELQARRKRRDDAVPKWERIFSDIYGLASDYGNSAFRPLGLLVALIAVFAGGYALLGSLPVRLPAGEDLWQALSFSTSRVLPFGPWADEPAAETMMGRLLHIDGGGHGAGTAFGIRLLATLQSLAAIVLVFLAGLAIRRRFQIN